MEPDGGPMNIRNVTSKHWTRWLGPENRCLVPFTSFSEFDKTTHETVWFALDAAYPLAYRLKLATNADVDEGDASCGFSAFERRYRFVDPIVLRFCGGGNLRANPRIFNDANAFFTLAEFYRQVRFRIFSASLRTQRRAASPGRQFEVERLSRA